MAFKPTLLLLAFGLLATRMASYVEDTENIGVEHRHHGRAPVHAPMVAHIHAPTRAPVGAPSKAPVHAPALVPAISPVYSTPKAPAYPPVPPTHGCVAMCTTYCKLISPKRPCMRTCTACCANAKCVPGIMNKCSNWEKVVIKGKLVKCP